jgi:hypothetical protein
VCMYPRHISVKFPHLVGHAQECFSLDISVQ